MLCKIFMKIGNRACEIGFGGTTTTTTDGKSPPPIRKIDTPYKGKICRRATNSCVPRPKAAVIQVHIMSENSLKWAFWGPENGPK